MPRKSWTTKLILINFQEYKMRYFCLLPFKIWTPLMSISLQVLPRLAYAHGYGSLRSHTFPPTIDPLTWQRTRPLVAFDLPRLITLAGQSTVGGHGVVASSPLCQCAASALNGAGANVLVIREASVHLKQRGISVWNKIVPLLARNALPFALILNLLHSGKPCKAHQR